MAETVGYVRVGGTDDLPFTVVFSVGESVIAEHPVNSRLSGEELIERLLPTLQGFEPR
jgi:hypothetical protein